MTFRMLLSPDFILIITNLLRRNQGHAGAAIAAYAKTKIHIESCTFSHNLAFGSSDSSNDYGAVGGVVYNAAEVMSILFSTFDDNSSQVRSLPQV